MARNKSRYADTLPFQADPRGNSTFAGLRPRTIGPAPGVIEHTVSASERLDRLATHYYNNDRLWWRIGDANSGFLHAPDMLSDPDTAEAGDGSTDDPLDMVGHTILIPKAQE